VQYFLVVQAFHRLFERLLRKGSYTRTAYLGVHEQVVDQGGRGCDLCDAQLASQGPGHGRISVQTQVCSLYWGVMIQFHDTIRHGSEMCEHLVDHIQICLDV
jgi:hypothetical protein